MIWAVGRAPNTRDLNLEAAGVETRVNGIVPVDDYQNTNVPGLFAIGDVTGKVPLTPVAIAAGRRLAERLFNGQPERRMDYENVPSVVKAEVWRYYGTMLKLEGGGERHIGLRGVPPETDIMHPRIVSGRMLMPDDTYAIVLSHKIAVEEGIQIGDEIMVVVIEIDRQGRVNLSRKAAMQRHLAKNSEKEGA